jgi:hypothetical protein
VSKTVLFPFLTAQFKSASQDASIQGAELQSLRDAAAIVRANTLVAQLVGLAPSPVATCHFSSTCDLNIVRLYLHYTLDPNHSFPTYITKEVYECRLKVDAEVQTWRSYMRNLYAWAISDRTAALKQTVALLATTQDLGPGIEDDDATTVTSLAEPVAPLSPSSTPSLRAFNTSLFFNGNHGGAQHRARPEVTFPNIVTDAQSTLEGAADDNVDETSVAGEDEGEGSRLVKKRKR